MTMEKKNLFSDLPSPEKNEIFDVLALSQYVRIERILSKGRTTPAGEWYDQELNEFVILLKGRANVVFKGEHEFYNINSNYKT